MRLKAAFGQGLIRAARGQLHGFTRPIAPEGQVKRRTIRAFNRFAQLFALLASFGWAAIALTVRATPLASVRPEIQLGFQLAVSGPVLLVLAPAFGPLLRDLQPLHLWGLAFQVICVASLGFLFWFHLMKIYRASGVASFSFLSPVLAVIFGWLILGEETGVQVWGALARGAVGLILINRK